MNILICSACKNKEFTELFSGRDYISDEEFLLSKCAGCGLVITNFDQMSRGLSKYYGSSYYGKRKSFSEDIINRLRVRKIFKILGSTASGFLLDIGCGNGSFFMKLREIGWSAFGTEIAPSDHLKSEAEKFIYRGDLIKNNLKNDSFDAVTMWHSLEHISNPTEYVSEARKVLKAGGAFIIEVPNFLSWQSKIFETNWFHLDVPRHLFHFSPSSLSVLLGKSGFKNVKVENGNFVYELFGWLQSVLNVFSVRKNLLFDLLNGKVELGMLFSDHPLDLLANVFFLLPGLLFAFALSILETLAGQSGVILVSARK